MAEQSGHSLEWITLGLRADGNSLRFPIHTMNSARPGPVVGISAGVHGDEVPPVETVRRLVRRIDPADLRGTLRIVPVANPLALEYLTRHSPQDMLNFNRVYPGNPDGWMTEQLAHAFVTHFVQGLDAWVDLHSGGVFPTVDYVYILNDEGLSRSFGFNVMYRTAGGHGDVVDPSIRRVTVEMGGGLAADEEYIERGVAGLLSTLRYLEMLPGDPITLQNPTIVERLDYIRPRQGGLLVPEMGIPDLGRVVPRGTVLGRTFSPYTFEELEVFEAPFERTVLILLRGAVTRVQPGDFVYMFGEG